jgi:hypothetical protein
MKNKLIATILICTAGAANASLIDLTPGGFNPGDGLPPSFRRTQTRTFFDSANPNGWVSRYGHINGGTYFFTDLMDLGPTPSASIWWNFMGQPEGYWLDTILVEGRDENGDAIAHIYGVRGRELFISNSEYTVILNGFGTIFSIAFYGLNEIPDTGSTALLFGLALVALMRFKLI